VTLEVEVVILSLTESYKGAPSWVTHLRQRSLHLRGMCIVRQTQVHLVTYCACDQLAGSMLSAPSMVGMVSLVVGVCGYCGDNLEDWCACMV